MSDRRLLQSLEVSNAGRQFKVGSYNLRFSTIAHDCPEFRQSRFAFGTNQVLLGPDTIDFRQK